MRIIMILPLCAVLAGCGTRYQEMGFTGGVAADQVSADTFRILARGNAYTSAETVQDYVLLKAAETTQAQGGTHFIIVGENQANQAVTITSGGTAQTTFAGNTAFTSYTPPTSTTMIKPGQNVFIKVLRLGPGQQAQGAISAAEIIQYTGARVKRS
jgi:hypothetical protein